MTTHVAAEPEIPSAVKQLTNVQPAAKQPVARNFTINKSEGALNVRAVNTHNT